MNDSVKTKAKGYTDLTSFSKVRIMRKYDMLDLMTISLYTAIIFSGGLGLGSFIWNQ